MTVGVSTTESASEGEGRRERIDHVGFERSSQNESWARWSINCSGWCEYCRAGRRKTHLGPLVNHRARLELDMLQCVLDFEMLIRVRGLNI